MRNLLTISLLILASTSTALANESSVAQTLMEGNKINSVLVILSVILLGILIFLITQDRRIKKLEDDFKP
jgi:hypothetical protein